MRSGTPAATCMRAVSATDSDTVTACWALGSWERSPPASSSATGSMTRRQDMECMMTSPGRGRFADFRLCIFFWRVKEEGLFCLDTLPWLLFCVYSTGVRSTWECGQKRSDTAAAWSSRSTACTTKAPLETTRWVWVYARECTSDVQVKAPQMYHVK